MRPTMAIATSPPEKTIEESTVRDSEEVQAVLDALHDPDCRAVLDATGEESLSASELSDVCELPLSTTYRKLDTLTGVGLLDERTRLCPDGKHASEYVRSVEHVDVDVVDGGFELTVTHRVRSGTTTPL
ncbi:winged helix-turn-helix domain-containing protein [Haloplanus pelagicus]|jgi:DNA-binding transcriptional ArsR family regulator|uniref:winged helix-turn-helix domain-containing protein n=1 Tax=Haloplanus pelagicus TaxID=2949995 RepID=UPI00204070CB|nr:helix-turn-helix domain-containing protein [Haloplanus sp. HW8-1]